MLTLRVSLCKLVPRFRAPGCVICAVRVVCVARCVRLTIFTLLCSVALRVTALFAPGEFKWSNDVD